MATLTIRKLDDKVVEDFKRIAKKNNRFTAGVLAHDIMTNSDLVQEMWDLLGDESLQADEELAPPRTDDARPIELG